MQTKNPQQRLQFLDVARGLAVLMVLAEHSLGECLPNLVPSVLGHGFLGRSAVILFFVISGFIIPASLEQGDSNARFWLRRVFRLFPAYWLSIAVAALVCACFGSGATIIPPLTPGDWLINLTMLQSFLDRPNVWPVFWTLQIELIIYVVFSILFGLRLMQRGAIVAYAPLAIYAAIGLVRPLTDTSPFDIGGQRLLVFAPLAGFVAHRWFVGKMSGSMFLGWGGAQVSVLGSVWIVNRYFYPERVSTEIWWELACTWGIAYTVFLALLANRNRRMPAPLCWVGRVSYSVYLLHPAVLVLVAPLKAMPLAFLLTMSAGSLALSELTFRFVESPAIALGRTIERWWQSERSGPLEAREFGTPPARRRAA